MMISEWKIKDIISTMLEMGMIDYDRAIVDNQYLFERIGVYLEAKKLANKILEES